MALQVHKGFFDSKKAIFDDIEKNNTWPTTFVSGPSDGFPIHWHSEEVHGYVMEGETDFLDVEIDQRIPVTAGDKFVIPARALHAEGKVKDRVVYILAMPIPLESKEFLVPRPPEEL